MSWLALRTMPKADQPGVARTRQVLLHAGIVALHAILVPYHLATEAHLVGRSVPFHDAPEHEHDHLVAHDHGHGHDDHHAPHASADHGWEGTRPEGCNPTVAAVQDELVPGESVIPTIQDGTRLVHPALLLAPRRIHLAPHRIRGPPSAATSLPS